MPTKKQLSESMESQFEFPQTRREDDPAYVKPSPPKEAEQKEEAIRLAEWIAENHYVYMGHGYWYHDVINERIDNRSTTEQLFSLFKSSTDGK